MSEGLLTAHCLLQSRFSLRLDQVAGCVLPRLPAGGERVECGYVDQVKVVCRLTCRGEAGVRTSTCHLYHGSWRGQQTCRDLRPVERLGECGHTRLTGCVMAGPLERSSVECGVSPGSAWCRVRCGEGMVSPGDWASCTQDSSGWEGRWSRLLLPCLPDCQSSRPRLSSGKVRCEVRETGLECRVSCHSGYSPAGGHHTSTCHRGVWTNTLRCVEQSNEGPSS